MGERRKEKGARFRALHEESPFVIPNPWDAGSAKVLAALGFEALATTSYGFAFSLGRPDGGVTLDDVVAHARALDLATELPLSVDLENGFGAAPEDAAKAIAAIAEAGAVGGSIEDFDADAGIYPLDLAVERVVAASEAAKSLDFPFTLTARADNYFRGNPDLDDTIARLQAYEQAGADVLFAPRLGSVEEIGAVAEAVGKPLNVLARPNLSMEEMVEAGAQRVSVGGALALGSIAALSAAAIRIRDGGDFSASPEMGQIPDWLSA